MKRRLQGWLARWGPVVPLLIAESTIWLGFGALLPILPLYFQAHGVDLPTLGVVVAAWPAARLVGEPVFGWLADRAPRRTMMVTGLVLASVFAVLPLFIVSPAAFIALRALSGLAAAMYDPAARAYLIDANPPDRQGEAFGLYGAAQTGGFMLGPAIGGIAAALTGQPEVVFWVAGITLLISALLIVLRVPEVGHVHEGHTQTPEELDADAARGWARPTRLLNLVFFAAICFSIGMYYAGGTYEVVWSVYMTSLGADIGTIGISFFTFGLPPLLLSAWMGRFIDRSGGFFPLVVGMFGVAACGFIYPLVPAVWWMIVFGLVEGTAFAMASPAIFLLAARAAPVGRTSTAQGLLGGAGTVGTIVASLSAGALADINLHFPFFAVGIAGMGFLAMGMLLGRRRLYDAMQPRRLPVDPVPLGASEGAA